MTGIHRGRRVAILSGIVLLLGLGAGEIAAQESATRIRALGGARTRFSPKPAATLGELQNQFVTYRADLESVLTQAGWDGDAEALFAAVRDAEEGGEAVRARAVAPGTGLEWMAYRKGGKPAVKRNVVWAGKTPFPAWEVRVESRGRIDTFIVPHACLNLALAGSEAAPPPPPPPSCSLRAELRSCEPREVHISASGDFDDIRIDSPSGAVPTGDNEWTLRPTADGSVRVTATASKSGDARTGSCSTEVSVDCPDPRCSIDVTYDDSSRLILVDGSDSAGALAITGLTLPDGSAGDVGALVAQGEAQWSYDPAATLLKKKGDYTYSFAAEARLSGDLATCENAVTVRRSSRFAAPYAVAPAAPATPGSPGKAGTPARAMTPTEEREAARAGGMAAKGGAAAGAWLVRGYFAKFDVDDSSTTRLVLPDGAQNRTDFMMSSAKGFGADAEYLLSDRIGIDFGILVGDIDSLWKVDFIEDWAMQNKDVGFTMFSAGVNFHLSPSSRADVFAGPFVALVDYSSETFRALGQTLDADLEQDTALGAQLGVDFPFRAGGPWAVTGSLRYLPTSTRIKGTDYKLDVDPLMTVIGISYSF